MCIYLVGLPTTEISSDTQKTTSQPASCFQIPKLTVKRKNYSFKCHRYDLPAGTPSPATSQSQNVFAVNTITFHKVQGTFCTGGSDGSLTFWDGVARTKLKRERDTSGVAVRSSSVSLHCQGVEQRQSGSPSTSMGLAHCLYLFQPRSVNISIVSF